MSYLIAVRRAMHDAHESLLRMSLKGDPPRLNVHTDQTLPACVYQPRTNCVAACSSKLSTMTEDEVRSIVLDAMAMCGCQRTFLAEQRTWAVFRHTDKLFAPILSMHGGPRWRHIRSKL